MCFTPAARISKETEPEFLPTPHAPPPGQERGRHRKLTMVKDPPTQGSTSLGERLKALRSARAAALGRKLSQQEVASAAGTTRSHVAMFENDLSKPGYDAFIALADYYGVSLDWLAKGGPPSPHHAKVCEITAQLSSQSKEYVDAVLLVIGNGRR